MYTEELARQLLGGGRAVFDELDDAGRTGPEPRVGPNVGERRKAGHPRRGVLEEGSGDGLCILWMGIGQGQIEAVCPFEAQPRRQGQVTHWRASHGMGAV